MSSILFCTQGTYPFAGGGVSTWCDILCRHLTDSAFTLYAVTGNPQSASKYPLPSNVRGVFNVPLWGELSPEAQPPRSTHQSRLVATTDSAIEAEFAPPLRRFVAAIFEQAPADITRAGRALYRLWQYFQRFDYQRTWASEPAWHAFVGEVTHYLKRDPAQFAPDEMPSVADLATGMHTLAHYLIPLNVPIPRVDIVHTTVAGFAGLPGIIARHVHNTPFIVTEHGVFIREQYIAISAEPTFSPFLKRFLIGLSNLVCRLNYHYADVVTTVAAFNRRWQVRYGVELDKTRVIYNGIDPNQFVPRPKPDRTAHRPTVVAAARVIPIKDIETMIRSAAVARQQIPDVLYMVFGATEDDPTYFARCQHLISDLNLENHFEFAGANTRPPDIAIHGDIGILSSISEGIPYAMLEAMACERPFVSTDVGGVREALEGCGYAVAPRDPDGLGLAVASLLRNSDLRAQLGRKARQRVLERFQVTQSVSEYRALYNEIVAAERTDRFRRFSPISQQTAAD